MSSAYLRLLIFLLAILIPACASSSPAFHKMYSAYKLNKHGDNIQPWRTPFPIWNQSIVSCLVLTVVSWPVYRFLRRQVRRCGILSSWRIFHSLWKWLSNPVFLPRESPWTEKPGRLQSTGSQRVRHNWLSMHIKSSKGKAASYIQGNSHKANSWLPQKLCRPEGSGTIYLKRWKGKVYNQE